MNKILIVLPILILSALSVSSHPGVGIVMDSKGNIFYTDLKHVWKIDTRGIRTKAVSNVHTHELHIDSNDNLYGEHLWYEGETTDKWGHYVWKKSSDGMVEKVIPDKEGFLSDYSFVRNHEEKMFWADRGEKCQHLMTKNKNEIEKLTGECFADIRWMTVSEKGNIYLVDKFDIKRVTPDAKVTVMAEKINERTFSQATVPDPHMVMGLWTDRNENVYVAIFGGRMVKKITPDKKISVVAETSMRWSPTGGLTAANGDFWLLECSPLNEVRVEQITKDGERRIFGD